MLTKEFDYELPRKLIADHPTAHREESRLMVVNRATREISHARFSDLPRLLAPSDLLVVNNTKVLHARLLGSRLPTGGTIELLLLERLAAPESDHDDWMALARPARKLTPGTSLAFANGQLAATVLDMEDDGRRKIRFHTPDVHPWMESVGIVPLPPYIVQRRKEQGLPDIAPEDSERYQTVYAKHPGSVAAPTAGLHFTKDLILQLHEKGIDRVPVTLHVGIGTFKPVEEEIAEQHPMHSERFTISPASAKAVNDALEQKRRVVAVGTTSVRAMEAAFDPGQGKVLEGTRDTRLFLLPGASFHVAGAMITNFHLPRSTLLMLVSAFADIDLIRRAYQEAVDQKYRFYSYGDAMLIL